MKNFICLIAFSLLFLLGIKGANMSSFTEEGETAVCVLQENLPVAQIQSIPSDMPEPGNAYMDAESLTGQFRLIGRSQRSLSFVYSFLSKGVASRLAQYGFATLLQSSGHAYTTLPHRAWSVSSEHYVFGMRRILI